MAAAYTGSYSRGFSVGGLTFGVNSTVDSSLGALWDETVAAAKTGQLTTRTDANTGVLTMSSGHGITTGARLDVYWTGGSRYGMTVGSVSGTTVPIDLGAGDDLPANLTNVTAMVPTELPIVVTGDDAVSVACRCPVGGTVVFADSGNTTIVAYQLTTTVTTAVWVTNQGTNPLAGASLAKVFISHGSSAASSDLSGAVQYNP